MSERWFARARDVLLASLADRWVAYAQLAGGSHLLNDEGAAILLALSPAAPLSAAAVCSALASDCGEPVAAIEDLVSALWDPLVSVGLVVEHASPTGP